MAKIIRLTESDLTRIVKRVLKEASDIPGTWPDKSVLSPLKDKKFKDVNSGQLFTIYSTSADKNTVSLSLGKRDEYGRDTDAYDVNTAYYDCFTKLQTMTNVTQDGDPFDKIPDTKTTIKNKGITDQIVLLYCSKFKPDPKMKVDYLSQSGQRPNSNV